MLIVQREKKIKEIEELMIPFSSNAHDEELIRRCEEMHHP
jgi:hypothetical protein